MSNEPSILRMDWKSLGYEKVYLNGKIRWIPANKPVDKQKPKE